MKQFSESHRQNMSKAAKARYTPEWRKKQSDRKATKLPYDEVIRLYESGMTQAEVGVALGVSQRVICNFMKRHGIKARIAAKRDQSGNKNHNWKGGRKVDKNGYIYLKMPGNPRARKYGDYIAEHDYVMEQFLGRPLIWNGADDPDTEIVHHINGDKHDNRIENLQLTTYAEHIKLHADLRKKLSEESGDANA